jgi:hypothetical protein
LKPCALIGTEALSLMGEETDKVGPCVALTIMFFMMSFTFTVLVYLIQAKEFEIVLVVLWPLTSFLIVLTFISYIYRTSDYVCVLEGHRITIGKKSDIKRKEGRLGSKPDRIRIITSNPWFHVKMKHPGKGVIVDRIAEISEC